MLVLAELLPMFRFEPERIAADPHPLVAPGQGAAELLAPAAGDSAQIELISFEIPLGGLEYLDAPRIFCAAFRRSGVTQNRHSRHGRHALGGASLCFLRDQSGLLDTAATYFAAALASNQGSDIGPGAINAVSMKTFP